MIKLALNLYLAQFLTSCGYRYVFKRFFTDGLHNTVTQIIKTNQKWGLRNMYRNIPVVTTRRGQSLRLKPKHTDEILSPWRLVGI